jgi:hypothetical protein
MIFCTMSITESESNPQLLSFLFCHYRGLTLSYISLFSLLKPIHLKSFFSTLPIVSDPFFPGQNPPHSISLPRPSTLLSLSLSLSNAWRPPLFHFMTSLFPFPFSLFLFWVSSSLVRGTGVLYFSPLDHPTRVTYGTVIVGRRPPLAPSDPSPLHCSLTSLFPFSLIAKPSTTLGELMLAIPAQPLLLKSEPYSTSPAYLELSLDVGLTRTCSVRPGCRLDCRFTSCYPTSPSSSPLLRLTRYGGPKTPLHPSISLNSFPWNWTTHRPPCYLELKLVIPFLYLSVRVGHQLCWGLSPCADLFL